MQFLALQNLPLQGDDDSNSNFPQILKLRGIDDSRIVQWLHKKIANTLVQKYKTKSLR